MRLLSDGALLRTIFIHFHEVAEGQREQGVLGGRERIEAECVFEARDEHGKAERVQTGIQQHQIVAQRRQRLAVFAGDLLPLIHFGYFYADRGMPCCFFTPSRDIRASLQSSSRSWRGQREWTVPFRQSAAV